MNGKSLQKKFLSLNLTVVMNQGNFGGRISKEIKNTNIWELLREIKYNVSI